MVPAFYQQYRLMLMELNQFYEKEIRHLAQKNFLQFESNQLLKWVPK